MVSSTLKKTNHITPPTITHIFWSLCYGGIETMLVNIANAQCKLGTKISIIIINNKFENSLIKSINSKIKVYIINRKSNIFDMYYIIKLNTLLSKINPDIIHLHQSNIYKFILSKKLKEKSCVTLHALPTGPMRMGSYPMILLKKLFSIRLPYSNVYYIDKINKVFSISEAVKKELLKKYNVKSYVIYNGIKTSDFSERNKIHPPKKLHIVQVSRLDHKIKGQDLLIKAASVLKEKISVDFIGTGPSIDYLKELAIKLSIEKNIHFLGKKEQAYISKHLSDYDLFIQPSITEGFGLTVAEAMAAKLPVLVSAGQGPEEIIKGNTYGWVFKNGDLDDLIQKIELIINEYDKAIEKASKALSFVKRMYDIKETANNYIKAYCDKA